MSSPEFREFTNADSAITSLFESHKRSIMSDINSGRIDLLEIGEIPIKYLNVDNLPGVPTANIMTSSVAYKPIRYKFAYDVWLRQNQLIWLPAEVPMGPDCLDWLSKLTDGERNLATHIFRLFVQNDFLVNNAYIHQYAKIFLPNEIQMAISAIANIESVHEAAYAHLLDSLEFPESEYTAFLEYKEMVDKYNFTAGFRMDTLLGIAVGMLVYGAFTEGLQLFASFAVLLNFPRKNKLKGMGQIVSWSCRDETLHVSFVANLFGHFMNEFGHLIDKRRLKEAAINACKQIVENEKLFGDLAFSLGPVDGMTKEDLYSYIEDTANERLIQFGMEPIYNTPPSPIRDWIDSAMGDIEFANFFETRATDYTQAATTGSWENAYN